MRIINEPTAAATAGRFIQTMEETELILVIDIGGGSYEVSVLCLSESVYEVLATCGDLRLGGRDFDQICFNMIKDKIEP